MRPKEITEVQDLADQLGPNDGTTVAYDRLGDG